MEEEYIDDLISEVIEEQQKPLPRVYIKNDSKIEATHDDEEAEIRKAKLLSQEFNLLKCIAEQRDKEENS